MEDSTSVCFKIFCEAELEVGRVERRYWGEEGEKMELHELTKYDVKMHTRYRKVCGIRHFSMFVLLVETR